MRVTEPAESMKTLLFIPVSSPTGAGEYYRCLTLADALARRQPGVGLHICLNRHAALMQPEGLVYHLLDDSPTLDVAGVEQVLDRLHPDIVVFDNTLRRRLLKKAGKLGSVIVYTSSRPKKRRKGFSPRKLPSIDRHWIIAPPRQQVLSTVEKGLLRLCGGALPMFLSTLLPNPESRRRDALLASYSFFPRDREYALFVSGGGGGTIDGHPAAMVFMQAARRYHQTTGRPTVFVGGPLSTVVLESSGSRLEIRAVSPEQLSDLISGAMLVVCGGGSMVYHVLALERPCLAVPAGGKDQPARIGALRKDGVIISCPPDADAMAGAAVRLDADEPGRQRLSRNAGQGGFANGLDRAVADLESVLEKTDDIVNPPASR